MGHRSEKRDPEASLPLAPAVFHVLLALADGDKHGYAIMKDIARRTAGTVKLGPGTLYGMIARLSADGMITEARQRPAPALDDERRRYYQLTPFGRAVAAAEAKRLHAVLSFARERHLLSEPV